MVAKTDHFKCPYCGAEYDVPTSYCLGGQTEIIKTQPAMRANMVCSSCFEPFYSIDKKIFDRMTQAEMAEAKRDPMYAAIVKMLKERGGLIIDEEE